MTIKIKRVFRLSPPERKLRLFRVLWHGRGSIAGDHFKNKLAVALQPRLAGWEREWDGWRLWLLGLNLHYQRGNGLV